MTSGLQIPVILLVFNRPETTARVFASVREARPARLLVVADGPRIGHPRDAARCRAVRALIDEGVDWQCDVIRDYAEVNQGCGRRVVSGLTRAFEQVDEAIILEDDCLPDPTFFPYMSELLVRYRDEPRVAMVSGSHHQRTSARSGDSYYFCRYGNIWGWGTWRRAWQRFDPLMRDWPAWRDAGGLEALFADPAVRKFWQRTWNDAASQRHNGWGYAWTYYYMHYGMLGILPRVQLVQNIGFGSAATHTGGFEDSQAPVEPMPFPLRHPVEITPDLDAEACASARYFTHRSLLRRIWTRLTREARQRGLIR